MRCREKTYRVKNKIPLKVTPGAAKKRLRILCLKINKKIVDKKQKHGKI